MEASSPSKRRAKRRSSSMCSRVNRLASVGALALALAGCKKEAPPAPPPAAAASEPAADVQSFCVATLRKTMDCFKDDNFWDVFATTYFAKYPDTSGNP